MGWTAQYFTTIIIEGDTPLTGIFIYGGAPGNGNLIGSWTAAAGTDAYGNSYPAGINVFQGQLTGVTVNSSTIDDGTINNSTSTNEILVNPSVQSGTITQTTIIQNTSGGVLLGYTTTANTVTESSNGDYSWTAPSNVTVANISCWGAGASGGGGNTTDGGRGGGGGEFAQEPSYSIVPSHTYLYTVGAGGAGVSTGTIIPNNGTASFFDNGGAAGGVYANPGLDNVGGTGSTNTVAFAGGTASGENSGGGGASGGNSGGTSATGNAGNPGNGTSGGASPSSQTGAGTGGAGGNSGENGSNGGSPGAGGGGAGNGSSAPETLTKTYTPTYCASYYGPDATGTPNGLRSTATMYQGGETSSGGEFNGNQRCVFVYNSDLIESDFSGYTPTGLFLTLVNQHCWYSSGMTVEIDVGASPEKYPPSAPSTWLGSQNKLTTVTMGEGTTQTFAFSATAAGWFTNNETNFMGLGAFVAADEPYNLNYYGYFANGVQLKITGETTVSGSNTSGNGSDGKVSISYSESSVLEYALAAVAGEDSNSNAYALGYTGPISAIQPGSSPTVVETWHDMTLENSWTIATGGMARYRFRSDNTVDIQLVNVTPGTVTSGTPIWVFPTGYVPTIEQKVPCIIEYTTAPSGVTSEMYLYVNPGTGLEVENISGTCKWIHTTTFYALD